MLVGVLGGTFDPVHLGHLIVAEEARLRLGLDKVIFMTAGQPWLKAERPVTPAKQRLEMVRLAIEANPYFEAARHEVDRAGPREGERRRDGEGARLRASEGAAT